VKTNSIFFFQEKISISEKYNFGVISKKKKSIFFTGNKVSNLFSRKQFSIFLIQKKIPYFFRKKLISDKYNAGVFSKK
jgi:hypothetical protein